MRLRFFLASALLGSAAPVSAQRFGFTHQMFPPDRDPSEAVAIGDLDGDGDLDLFRATDPQPPRIYLNDGVGAFADLTPLVVSASPGSSESVALGDVDGDGDLDAYVGNLGQDRLYLNGGGGAFVNVTAASLPASFDSTYAVAFGDVDLDGDPDVYAGNGGQERLLLNGGAGIFADATATNLPTVSDGTAAVALGDVDGDGDLDAYAGNYILDRLYLNVGGGAFASAPVGSLPVLSASTTSVALGDVDGDGDVDAYVGNVGQDRLYLNGGLGVFVDVTAINLPALPGSTMSVALGDVDADGDLDALLGEYGSPQGPPAQSRLYLNVGAGVFADATATNLPALLQRTVAVGLADVDGDADLDAIVANVPQDGFLSTVAPTNGQDRLYLNDGAGIFTDVTATSLWARVDSTQAVALGDVDGDGDLDAFVGNTGQDRLFLSDPGGAMTDVTAANLPAVSGTTNASAFGDMDGDGDLDAFLGRDYLYSPFVPGLTNLLYSNAGNGVFVDATATSTSQPGELDRTRAVALGDVDGDGDLDALVGKGGGNFARLFRNTGGLLADVTPGNLPTATGDTRAVALGDVDGDGDLDAIVGNFLPGGDRLLLNGGTGAFTDATGTNLPILPGATNAVALGDMNGDGDLDAFFGKTGQSFLLPNLGTGVFSAITGGSLPILVDSTTAVALGDVEADGDLDAFLTNVDANNAGETLLLLNGGTGTLSFAPATALPNLITHGFAVALGDIDGDGDLDALVGQRGPEFLYTNLARQVSWRGLPRMGKPLTLDVDGPANGTWLLAASAGNASIPLPPFGTLRLFPPTLFIVAGGVLGPQGRASVTFPVPANPALVGLSLYWQAVVGPPLRLTNLEVTTVTNF